MAHEPDDIELRRRFAALRDAERRLGTPDFNASWTRAAVAGRRSRGPARWLLAGGALAAALLAVALIRRPARSGAVDLAAWQSPTAMLLSTPGDALLRGIPALGSSSIPFIVVPNLVRGIP